MAPLVLLNVVGLTPRLLAHTPRLRARLPADGQAGGAWLRPLREVLPAVTCTAQASLLTGQAADGHGIVANGWLFRDTGEVRFWQQSNRLLQAEPLYATARRRAAARGRAFRCAKLFWWFNQGADVDVSVTPKPYYAADGNKAFGITGTPEGLAEQLEKRLGRFPFPTFWGPMAGRGCTGWIAAAAATILTEQRPDLTLVYLPHLDYDPQRFGPQGCDLPRLCGELDADCAPLLDAARAACASVWLVSEYGHTQVGRPVYLNRALRQGGWLGVRPGPFGETLETFTSRAFAVCDHQLAHVYVREAADVDRVRDLLAALPGVARRRRRGAGRTGPPAPARRRAGRAERAGRLVRLPVLARRPPGPRLCARWTSIASPATTPASCSSTRACSGRRAAPPGGCCRRSSGSARCSTSCRSMRRWCAAATAYRRPRPRTARCCSPTARRRPRPSCR